MLKNDPCSSNLGIKLREVSPGTAIMSMQVNETMLNGFNICHGGMVFCLADSTFACACNSYDRVTVALGVDIEFMRPSFLHDELVATAAERKRGTTTGIYDIEVVNQNGKLVALFRGKAYITREKILEDNNHD